MSPLEQAAGALAPAPPPLDPAAGRARLARARSALAARGVAAAVAHDPLTLRHLATLVPERWPAALLIEPDDALLAHFVPGLFEEAQLVPERQLELSGFDPSDVVGLEAQLTAALRPALTKVAKQADRIGVEADTVPGWLWALLRELGAAARIVDVGPELRALRRAKDPDELAVIAYNAALAEAAYATAARTIRPGATEVDVYVAMVATVQQLAGGPVPHVGDFASGPGGGLRGGWPTRRVLEAGDSYVLDWQTGVGGYWVDLTRTFTVGPPSQEWRRAFATVEAALDAAAGIVMAGVATAAVDRAARDGLRGAPDLGGPGYPHITGHGTGAISHEAPYLTVGSDERLVAGDVITIEPGLYGDEALRGGVRIEDDYLVLGDGVRRLSDFRRDWHEVVS